MLLADGATSHRPILGEYSPYLLDQMIAVVTASTLIAYIFYTISPETAQKFGTEWLGLTIPFPLYGIFRYLYLVHQREGGGSPADLLLNDRPLLACVTLWVVAVVLIIYHRALTMPDFNVRSDSVNVEQIMEQIRARIREKRGVDYTEEQIRELAAVKLEKFLDPRGVRSDLLEQFRRAQVAQAPPAPPNYRVRGGYALRNARGPGPLHPPAAAADAEAVLQPESAHPGAAHPVAAEHASNAQQDDARGADSTSCTSRSCTTS